MTFFSISLVVCPLVLTQRIAVSAFSRTLSARAKEINQVKADYDVTKLTYKNHRLIFFAVGLFYLRV